MYMLDSWDFLRLLFHNRFSCGPICGSIWMAYSGLYMDVYGNQSICGLYVGYIGLVYMVLYGLVWEWSSWWVYMGPGMNLIWCSIWSYSGSLRVGLEKAIYWLVYGFYIDKFNVFVIEEQFGMYNLLFRLLPLLCR